MVPVFSPDVKVEGGRGRRWEGRGGGVEGGHIWDKACVQVTDYYRLTPVLVV